jgi:hypothetical protein
VLKQVRFSTIIARKLDSYLLYFKQRNCKHERLIIVSENSGDPLRWIGVTYTEKGANV